MAGKISSKIKSSAQQNTVGVIIAIVVLLVILLVGVIAVNISKNNKAENKSANTSSSKEDQNYSLLDNAQSNSVTAYVEKGVTADEKHYSISMTISADNRTIRVLKGYQNVEDKSEGLPNNIEAYKTFLMAIDRYNFTQKREDKSEHGWRGACPTQKGYRFKLSDQAYEQFDRWYSSCDGVRYGDYGGKVGSVYNLFRDQFPNYGEITSGISL